MKDIVIDADIMRAAGISEHPHSSCARRVLEAISEGGHRMVQCKPIKDEHDRHQGLLALRWRAMMVSKRQWMHWPYVEDATLRQKLVAALPKGTGTSKERAVEKDAHLLEAAAATGQRIVSKDSRARSLFRHACPNLGRYRQILWGDLTEFPDAVIQWIKDGCPERNDFKLCPPAGAKNLRKGSSRGGRQRKAPVMNTPTSTPSKAPAEASSRTELPKKSG